MNHPLGVGSEKPLEKPVVVPVIVSTHQLFSSSFQKQTQGDCVVYRNDDGRVVIEIEIAQQDERGRGKGPACRGLAVAVDVRIG